MMNMALKIAALNTISPAALVIAIRDSEARDPQYVSDPVQFIATPPAFKRKDIHYVHPQPETPEYGWLLTLAGSVPVARGEVIAGVVVSDPAANLRVVYDNHRVFWTVDRKRVASFSLDPLDT